MPPKPFDCRRCGSPIRIVREVDSGRRLFLNAAPSPSGTVVMLGDRAQIVPAGPSLVETFTLHTCRSRR
ncbi:MAG: hypothetical protein AB7G65_19880 [Thermoleophilia bacterium]